MRFLTRDWHAGKLPDDEGEDISAAYRAHRSSVLANLPVAFREFVQTVDIHDALVREIRLDRMRGTLELELRAGDLQAGYFDLVIRYAGIDLRTLDTTVLASIGRETRAEALYHEADLAPGELYEHRWLWWPYQDLDIRFRAFDFVVVPRPDRAFERSSDAFVEIRSLAV